MRDTPLEEQSTMPNPEARRFGCSILILYLAALASALYVVCAYG